MLEHAVWAKQRCGNESFKVRGYLKVPRKAHFLLPLSRTLSRVNLLAKSLPSAVNRCFCYVNEAITSSPQERSCWATFTSTSDSLCPKSWDSPCSIYSTWVWSRRRSPRCRFRPVVLTLHVMKTMDWLLLHHRRPQNQHALNPLQYAYLEKMRIEDPTIYLLHRSLSHLDRGSSAMRIIFLDVSRTWRQTHRNGSRTTPSGLDHRPTGRP